MEENFLKNRNKKHKLVAILLAVGLISLTLGVTMAFFNYTRTGSANVLAVGRIYFNSTQGTSINLTNVFPVKSTELENNPNISSVTLTITGDTTYNEGLEYLVSADGVVNTVSGKKVPIGTSVTVNNLGTSDTSYFTNRGGNSSIYKILAKDTIKEDGELVVGYITKGATGVNGTVTVSAWIDADKIAITDTPDENTEWQAGREVLTTEEWNALQNSGVSFQIKVEANEGIWVIEPLTALGKIANKVNTTTLINFGYGSSDTNGKGIYILPGTESDTHPIYYYRGAVDNNNVVFGNYCWQIVRTTDTGGIKMIYNGPPDIEKSGTNTTYNCSLTRKFQNSIKDSYVFNSNSEYYFADDYEIVSTSGNSATYKLKSKINPITSTKVTGEIVSSIVANYPYTCAKTSEDATCTVLYKMDGGYISTQFYTYASTHINTIGRKRFPLYSNSMNVSDVGYMNNTRFSYSNGGPASNSIFGKNIEWNGTNYLVIEDTSGIASTNEILDANHHYTCGTASETTCTSVRYYYYNSGSSYYYIILSNGELIEDALYKMTGNGDAETKARNSSYNINVNNSMAKQTIDNWFRTNLTSEVDTNNPDYSAYLEDTVYCNDRSYKTSGSRNTYIQSGWNKAGGNLSTYLYFGTHNRYNNSWYSTSNVPSMTCPNETDRFTVSTENGNGMLTYPVGLLTADEIILAGAVGSNNSFYLYTGDSYWTMTPSSNVSIFGLANDSLSSHEYFHISALGVRPVVSLKSGIEFESVGDGTPLNPYVVKYN